jgi:hypothetical protein
VQPVGKIPSTQLERPLGTPHRLSGEHLARLAKRIGEHPVSDLPLKFRKGRKLTEHFECWYLLNCEPVEAGVRLMSLAKKSGLMHHQIRSGAHAVQYAISRESNNSTDDRMVHAVFTSTLAQKIDRGIRWLDAQSGVEECPVHLLFVPSRHIHALWLNGERDDRLLVVSKPNMGSALRYERLHSLKHFLKVLSKRRPIMRIAVTPVKRVV